MSRTLDWKWIGIGVLIMFGLNIAAGLILALFWGPELQQAAEAGEAGEIALSGGQAMLLALIGFLAFAIGGYIVGVRSAGRTILEPGISAAIAVALSLLIAGNFTLLNLIAGGLVPFVAGLLGGWLGERKQGTA
jgi:hypothetical protein